MKERTSCSTERMRSGRKLPAKKVRCGVFSIAFVCLLLVGCAEKEQTATTISDDAVTSVTTVNGEEIDSATLETENTQPSDESTGAELDTQTQPETSDGEAGENPQDQTATQPTIGGDIPEPTKPAGEAVVLPMDPFTEVGTEEETTGNLQRPEETVPRPSDPITGPEEETTGNPQRPEETVPQPSDPITEPEEETTGNVQLPEETIPQATEPVSEPEEPTQNPQPPADVPPSEATEPEEEPSEPTTEETMPPPQMPTITDEFGIKLPIDFF